MDIVDSGHTDDSIALYDHRPASWLNRDTCLSRPLIDIRPIFRSDFKEYFTVGSECTMES